MTNHVMIDLETLDNVGTAAIVAIGACVFSGPKQGEKFYTAVDQTSSIALGLSVSLGTMEWWAKQTPQARAVFDDPDRLKILVALEAFAQWLFPLGEDVRVWGNGASFDNAILAHAYRKAGRELPWAFWNDRCYRTIAAGISERREQLGTHHNALDDALSQAQHLVDRAPWALV